MNRFLIIALSLVACQKNYPLGDFSVQEVKDIPLVRVLKFRETNKTKFTVTVKGKTEDMDISKIYPAKYGTEFPVLGLYPNYTNRVEISYGKNMTNIIVVTQTDKLEAAKIHVDMLPQDNDQNRDLFFVGFVNFINMKTVLVGYDRKGDPRYYNLITDKAVINQHRIENQNNEMVMMNDLGIFNFWSKDPILATPKEIKFHHDMVPYKHNYLILANSKWGLEDRLVELTESGTIVRDLLFGSLFQDIVLPVDRPLLNRIVFDKNNKYKYNGKEIPVDWAHANSILYDSKSDILYISLRHQGVLAVKYSAWELIWWMTDKSWKTKQGFEYGEMPDPSINLTDIPSLDSYRVKGDALHDGPRNQHALFLHKNGNLGMFDNAGDVGSNPNGSRYLEYKITRSNDTWLADKVREYKDKQLYSRLTSDVDFSKDGSMLILWGVNRRVRELNLHNQIMFDMEFPNPKRMNSKFCDVVYRVDKMPLYPYEDKARSYMMDYNAQEER